MYIVNNSDSAIVVPDYYILVGFPTKGCKFEHACKNPALQLKYVVPDQDTKVIYGNALVEIHTLIEERRNTDPKTAKVLFHTMCEKPAVGRPGGFALELKEDIWYTLPEQLTLQPGGVKGEGGTANVPLSQGVAGAAIGFDKWARASLVKPLWVVKWRSAGVQPCSPRLACPQGFSILPKQAVKVL